jgi:hypothetical protein
MNGITKGSLRYLETHPLANTPAQPTQEVSQFQSLKLEVAMMVYAAIYARSSFTQHPAKDAWEAAELFIEEMQTREKQ